MNSGDSLAPQAMPGLEEKKGLEETTTTMAASSAAVESSTASSVSDLSDSGFSSFSLPLAAALPSFEESSGSRRPRGSSKPPVNQVSLYTLPQSCVLPLEYRPLGQHFIFSPYPYVNPKQLQAPQKYKFQDAQRQQSIIAARRQSEELLAGGRSAASRDVSDVLSSGRFCSSHFPSDPRAPQGFTPRSPSFSSRRSSMPNLPHSHSYGHSYSPAAAFSPASPYSPLSAQFAPPINSPAYSGAPLPPMGNYQRVQFQQGATRYFTNPPGFAQTGPGGGGASGMGNFSTTQQQQGGQTNPGSPISGLSSSPPHGNSHTFQ